MIKRLVTGLAVAVLLLPCAGYADFDRDDCYGRCKGRPLRLGQVSGEIRLSYLA